MDTLKGIVEELRNKMVNHFGVPVPRLTEEEYEALKAKVAAHTYHGICRPDCEICGGAGHVRIKDDADFNDPDFGKTKLCPNIDHAKAYALGMGLDESEIRSLNWSKINVRGNVMEAVNSVRETTRAGYGWVTLWGDFGVAKSLILRVSVAEKLRDGRMAAFVSMTDILDDLRASYDKEQPDGEATARLAKWKNIPFLAVDEVDKINQTPWAKEKQFEIFNYRYQTAIRQQTVTLFASNLSPTQIGGALGDRLLDGRFSVVHLDGSSNRPIIGQGQDY
jgi:hypothetical protein